MENNGTMKRNIGVLSGLGILVGYVIGASIFVTPGTLAESTGPHVWLAYFIAGIPAFTLCFVYAQLGTLVPVSGAIYVFSSLTITNRGGYLYSIFTATELIFSTPLMAITMATYLQVFIPDLNITISALVIMLLTFGLNFFGNRVGGQVQNFAILFLAIVVLIFTFGGVIKADWSHFTPAFPNGVSPILAGVLSCYYSFAGFNILTEMSGEIKNPSKNIPRILFLGFSIVMLLYVGTCVSLVALVPYTELGIGEPVVFAATKIFNSGWFGTFLALAAICGCWTTLNASFLGLPRTLMQLGRSKFLPKIYTKLNRFGVPIVSLSTFMCLALVAFFISDNVLFLIDMGSLFLMLVAILVCIGSLRIKKCMHEEYLNASYKLKGAFYYIWPILTLLGTGYFLADYLIRNPIILLSATIFIGIMLLIYTLRKNTLKKQGIDMDKEMQKVLTESE